MKKFLIAALVLASAGVYAQSATPSCCQKAAGTTPSCSSAGASKTGASCHDKAGMEKTKASKSKKSSGKPGKKSDVAVMERRIEIRENGEGMQEFLQNFPINPTEQGDRIFFFERRGTAERHS